MRDNFPSPLLSVPTLTVESSLFPTKQQESLQMSAPTLCVHSADNKEIHTQQSALALDGSSVPPAPSPQGDAPSLRVSTSSAAQSTDDLRRLSQFASSSYAALVTSRPSLREIARNRYVSPRRFLLIEKTRLFLLRDWLLQFSHTSQLRPSSARCVSISDVTPCCKRAALVTSRPSLREIGTKPILQSTSSVSSHQGVLAFFFCETGSCSTPILRSGRFPPGASASATSRLSRHEHALLRSSLLAPLFVDRRKTDTSVNVVGFFSSRILAFFFCETGSCSTPILRIGRFPPGASASATARLARHEHALRSSLLAPLFVRSARNRYFSNRRRFLLFGEQSPLSLRVGCLLHTTTPTPPRKKRARVRFHCTLLSSQSVFFSL